LALAGCIGKDTSKPRLVIDASIMKEIGDDLKRGFGLGQGHSILLLLHFSRCRRREGREGIRLKSRMLISLRLRTNYVIRVMRIKDKGDRKINSNNYK
jgi:hypothetical protein